MVDIESLNTPQIPAQDALGVVPCPPDCAENVLLTSTLEGLATNPPVDGKLAMSTYAELNVLGELRRVHELIQKAPYPLRSEKYIPMPPVTKYEVIRRERPAVLPDGRKNWEYWIGTAGVAQTLNQLAVLYKGTDEPQNGERANHNHGLALIDAKDGHTVTYRHPDSILKCRENDCYPEGFEDARITEMNWSGVPEAAIMPKYLITATAYDKGKRDKGLFADKSKKMDGCYTYLWGTDDPSDPESFFPIGQIGPDWFFKNMAIHSEIKEVNGKTHLVLFTRKYPSIQTALLPLEDLTKLTNDREFRNAFWQQWEDNLAKNPSAIVMEPIFPWESKGHEKYPKGQIAIGGPPMFVDYPEQGESGRRMKAWLAPYNSVPDFMPSGDAVGRVIGVALLDGNNPSTVVARSPRPIITPTEPHEVWGRYPLITFTAGAHVSYAHDQLRIYYTAGDQALWLATMPLEETLAYISQFDAQGRLREGIRPPGK